MTPALRRSTVLASLATLGAALAGLPVAGQNAIGDGRALDANLGTSSGGVNPLLDDGDEFRARNLIVTNNVIGGRGFRDSVGYTAADAFRGDAGSDELYRFRADSAWSGVNLVNFGSTYQRFRFGQDAGLIEYQRTGQGASAGSLANRVYDSGQLNDARLRLDQLSFASLSENAQEALIQPTIVGAVTDRTGANLLVRASSLGGLERTPVNQVSELIGLTSYDFARVAEDVQSGRETESQVGAKYKTSYANLLGSDLMASTRIDVPAGETRLDLRRPVEPGVGDVPEDEAAETVGAHRRLGGDVELEAIRMRVAERFARLEASGVVSPLAITRELTPEMLDDLDADITLLRQRLSGRPGPDGEGAQDDGARDGEDPRASRLSASGGLTLPPPPEDRLDDIDPTRTREDELDAMPDQLPARLREFGAILRHGQKIDQLSTPDDDTRFNELLASAEQALREGRYFWAERRFNRALRFTPGHPMATAGLLHTQIGAGLYLSASLTLRNLYVSQPEMIDARFAPELQPNRPRLLEALGTLDARLVEQRDRTATALLYAYIGRLVGERATIERGLAVMAEDSPNDPLLPLLRAIWLADETPADTPAPEK